MANEIIYVGLYKDRNFGDPIIGHCSEVLLNKYVSGCACPRRFDINDVYSNVPKILLLFRRIVNFIKSKAKINMSILLYPLDCYFQYRRLLKLVPDNSRAVIFVGGGIISYTFQFFGSTIRAVTAVCNKKNIPVIFNSVGVEEYSSYEWRCKVLTKCLLDKSVRYVSTRDNYDNLVHGYLKNKNRYLCHNVSDPAVWASECYCIKSTANSNKNHIGINVGRGGLFKDYGVDFNNEDIFHLYVSLIEKLSSDYKVTVFTNGHCEDNIMAESVVCRANHLAELVIPRSPEELVIIESTFSGIIATRLHSFIVAYSLNVPAVSLVWNQKIDSFGHKINAANYLISYPNFNVLYITSALKNALDNGYDTVVREQFRNTIVDSISNEISKIL